MICWETLGAGIHVDAISTHKSPTQTPLQTKHIPSWQRHSLMAEVDPPA